MRTTLRNTFDLQHNRPKRFQHKVNSDYYRGDRPHHDRCRRDDFDNPRPDRIRRDNYDNEYRTRPAQGRKEYRPHKH